MASIPETQKAWIAVRRGTPRTALELKSDWPVPSKLEPGEVLVKVQAAALNPVGYKLLQLLPNFVAPRPMGAEYDFAGAIVDGNGTEFKDGDQVFGFVDVGTAMKTRQGSLAQYLRVTSQNVVHRPENTTPIEAAGITLAAQTAFQMLASAQPGQTVFVYGGSSSVGAFAIQIAKARGCTVVASASAKNEEFVRKQGADEFIDYTAAPIHQQLVNRTSSPKFDLVVDAIGLADPSLYTYGEAYMKPNGLFVTVGPQPHKLSDAFDLAVLMYKAYMPTWLGGAKHPFKLLFLEHKKADLIALKNMMADGTLKPVVDSTFGFEDTLDAYDRLMSSRAKGKVVINVEGH